MGFFKNLINDIKTNNTPIGIYKDKLTDYFNFISTHSSGKSNISDETAGRKAMVLVDELFELSDKLDKNSEITLYLPNADLSVNIGTSVLFIEQLQFAFECREPINIQLINKIVRNISNT